MGETTTKQPAVRFEHDLLGERTLPADAYWTYHDTAGSGELSDYGRGAVSVSRADSRTGGYQAGHSLGQPAAGAAGSPASRRSAKRANCCAKALARPVSDRCGAGWAGTSTNMNANEVICNIALGAMADPLGDYDTRHPNEHVNPSQSTNDVYPTALKLATYRAGQQRRATESAGRQFSHQPPSSGACSRSGAYKSQTRCQ